MKIFILTLFLSSVFGGQIALGQAQIPERTWKLDSCEIRKDSAGVVSPIYYLSGDLNFESDNSENRNISPEMEGIPHGLWLVTQVTIEKNTDGRVEKTIYNSADEVKSHNPCPKELEINEKTATLRYLDGSEENAEYSTEDDMKLTLTTIPGQKYRYETKDGNPVLTAVYHYVNNDLKAKRSEDIREQRIIYLKTK